MNLASVSHVLKNTRGASREFTLDPRQGTGEEMTRHLISCSVSILMLAFLFPLLITTVPLENVLKDTMGFFVLTVTPDIQELELMLAALVQIL